MGLGFRVMSDLSSTGTGSFHFMFFLFSMFHLILHDWCTIPINISTYTALDNPKP